MALLSTGTITGNAAYGEIFFKGGEMFLHLDGEFSSGTATVELSYDNRTTWIPVSIEGAFSQSTITNVVLPDCWVRVRMAGSTSPSVVFAFATRSPV